MKTIKIKDTSNMQEELFTALDTLQCELNKHTRNITTSLHTANRIRYEASANAMQMIRDGKIVTATELKEFVYCKIEENLKTNNILYRPTYTQQHLFTL